MWRWGRNYSIPLELQKMGHKITLCNIADTEKLKLNHFSRDNMEILEFPDLLKGRLRSGWDPYCTLTRIRTFKKLPLDFDLIHAFETRPATIYPVKAYLKRKNVPLIIDWNDWWGRGGLIEENRPLWYKYLFGGIETYYEENYRVLGQGHTVVSSALKERLNSLGINNNIFFLPNGCNPDYFCPKDKQDSRIKLGIQESAKVILFTGYEVLNDLDLVLNSFITVNKTFPESQLFLTGRETLLTKKYIHKYNLGKRIIQTGYVDEDTLLNYLSAADVCLLPFTNKVSNLGRFPGKFSEYLSMGKSIVTNPYGVIGELLAKDPTIGIAADSTPLDFAEKIISLLNNPDMQFQIGESARNYAIKNLSWSKIAKNLVTFYKTIL